MNWYFVTLEMIIGEFEKMSHHVVQAKDEHKAGTVAIVGECHGQPDWTDKDKNESKTL